MLKKGMKACRWQAHPPKLQPGLPIMIISRWQKFLVCQL